MTMRFYTLLLTFIFVLNIQLKAHTFEPEILTPAQITEINTSGLEGAQSVIANLDASEFLTNSETVIKLTTEIVDLLVAIDSSDDAILEFSKGVSKSILLLSNDIFIDLNADGISDYIDISLLVGAIAEGAAMGASHKFIEVAGDVNGDGRIDSKDISPEIKTRIINGLTESVSTTELNTTAPDSLINYSIQEGVNEGIRTISTHLRTHNDFSFNLVHPKVETPSEDPTIVSPVQ
ncbi:MAG: hypothetical protein CL961_00730 [Euryarchaeota archaeon]|nr:hypothetical protein [Euryarchaeota archaeon]